MVFIHVTGVRFPYGLQNLIKKLKMANHKSALKRIRTNRVKQLRNKYQHKTTRNAVRVLRAATEKEVAVEMFPKVVSMLDKLAKNNVIHKNKASNLKSKLAKHVAAI
jgi:small subunit ribosomal protein S20